MRKLSAVVVEDDPMLGDLFASVLTMAGFKTELVPDSREAFGKIVEIMPHLVTLDMQMPHVSGADVLRQLRDDPRLQQIKVMVVSASAQVLQEHEIQDLADIVLMKPVSFSQITDFAMRLVPQQFPEAEAEIETESEGE